MCLGKWAPVWNPDGAPGSWLRPGSSLATVTIWRVNQHMEDLFLYHLSPSLYALLPFKQINKHLFFKKTWKSWVFCCLMNENPFDQDFVKLSWARILGSTRPHKAMFLFSQAISLNSWGTHLKSIFCDIGQDQLWMASITCFHSFFY